MVCANLQLIQSNVLLGWLWLEVSTESLLVDLVWVNSFSWSLLGMWVDLWCRHDFQLWFVWVSLSWMLIGFWVVCWVQGQHVHQDCSAFIECWWIHLMDEVPVLQYYTYLVTNCS